MFDLALYAIVLGILNGMFSPAVIDKIGDFGLSMLLLSSWVFVEFILLSVFGTTPGKALFRIHLLLPGSNSIPFLNAFYRSLRVWFFGLGAGFAIIAAFTLWHAESMLSRDSITSWDREGGFVVGHERIGAARSVVAAAFSCLVLRFYRRGNDNGNKPTLNQMWQWVLSK
jgi:hypothetical protein